MVAMDFFAASRFYNFFNKYCSNLLKNPTVRGLTVIREYGSTLYVGLARAVSPTNTNFRLTFL